MSDLNDTSPIYYDPKSEDGVSCWNAIESATGKRGFEDYCVGCIIKYLWRFREKNGVQDLKKSQKYLSFLISSFSPSGVTDE